MRAVMIRPEQAERILALKDRSDQARKDWLGSIEMALLGLVDGQTQVKEVRSDGTVLVEDAKAEGE